MTLTRSILNKLKNLPGWHTCRKLVVFNVDDDGNIRLGSWAAADKLTRAAVALTGRLDRLDTLKVRAADTVLDTYKTLLAAD